MPFQRNDILLAFKHIALSDQLNGTEKQFAAFLIDSYNRKTSRCDPSEETAAFLLGVSVRTIIRAGNRLTQLKLFLRRKHAGHNHCNSYEPNWQLFRENEDRYKSRRREHANRFARQKLSRLECQPCHLNTANTGIQTSLNNNIQSTYPTFAAAAHEAKPGTKTKEKRLSNGAPMPIASDRNFRYRDPMPLEAANISAERRWNNALIDQFGTGPVYAVIIEEMDVALQDAATKAELKQRGAGITCILQQIAYRGVRLEKYKG
jgi:hypothetical protein